jgi:hypothetical protein
VCRKDKRDIKVLVAEPYLPVEEYARRTGESVDAVRGQIRRGRLPIRRKQHVKDRVYINMTALHIEAAGEGEDGGN